MKKIIKKIIYNFPIILRKYILLESNPDFSDNAYSLYDTLIKEKVNEKYKIYWLVNDKNKFNNINTKNVYFVNFFGKKTFFEKLFCSYLNYKAKYILDCNKFVYKKNKRQRRLHLGHGMPYKNVPEYCNGTGEVDYILSLADFFNDNISKLHIVDKNKIINLGFPRNDALFSSQTNIKSIFNYKKILLWLPTYRQRENKDNNLSMEMPFPLGLPIIYNIDDLTLLNEMLKELDILIILKPHPAQDLSLITTQDFSNFKILTNDDLNKYNINLYEFLGQTDGLITDYSSVYYDYLLTDKPIAITTDDFEQYKKNFDFVYDNIFDVIKGNYLNTFEDLQTFIQNISSEKDPSKEERIKIKNKLHQNQDGNSSKRVYEFLKNKMGMN